MKRKLLVVISILAGTAVMLSAVLALHYVAVRVTTIQLPLLRAGAELTTLVLGVLLLVGATYFSTHLVVRLYRKEATSDQRSFANAQDKPATGGQ